MKLPALLFGCFVLISLNVYAQGSISWNNQISTPSFSSLVTEDECYGLWERGEGYYKQGLYRWAYDTLRSYVENCYNTTGHFFPSAFITIGSATHDLDPAPLDPENMVNAREWFKSVLYLRDDTEYYCADVTGILQTTTYWEGRGNDYNATLAVLKYIFESNKCPGLFKNVNWDQARKEQYDLWRDTVKDSFATPLDTTLPDLEEIGMEILSGKPQSDDTCARWFEWKYVNPFTKEEARQKYDTLRMYVEYCATKDNKSWQVFGSIGSAVMLYSNDTNRWNQYREWLISVLYLNPLDQYYCVCLGEISTTYQTGAYHPMIASLAIRDFMRSEGRCWDSLSQVHFTKDSTWAEEEGFDPTNLPPLDSLGLGFLLKAGVADLNQPSRTYLASFGASPNPFDESLNLQFELNRTSYISIQIFDLLGRDLWQNPGRTFEQGKHEITVNAKSLPKGTLYTRITTAFGEVKTVKLIRE